MTVRGYNDTMQLKGVDNLVIKLRELWEKDGMPLEHLDWKNMMTIKTLEFTMTGKCS